ncbi:MAG: SurA N-terminal domain-containing protein [Campylobacteraceae bacterium]|jgi:peptidyl-prolyl cis-trans isomerase D|nr:SurA N-terminal domain-containing protein [Campylobacteraceae bacterium]
MITWMQRHKKYLIITVWISVIAFVGAGFVSWGAYDFNFSRASSVAKVGNHKISKEDFSKTYDRYFQYFNTRFYNGELTPEAAKEIGLENLVMEDLVSNALLLNLADEFGIMALDSEVIEVITKDPNFHQNGVFNKEIYLQTLKRAGFKPEAYENTIKKEIVLEKLEAITTNFPITETEKEILGAAMFMEDRLSIGIVTVDDNELKIDENEIKTYWDMNKNNFLTERVYYLESIFVPLSNEKLNEDDIKAHYEETKYFYRDAENNPKEYAAIKNDIEKALKFEKTKRDALITGISLRNGNITAEKNITVKESSGEYNISIFAQASEGTILEPVQKENGWEVLKLVKVDAPVVKTYEEAKAQVLGIIKTNKRVELLAQKSLARLELFKGRDVGFITRSTGNITGLTAEQSKQVVNRVFGSKEKKGYVILDGKAYLYDILEQRLPDKNKIAENDANLENAFNQIRNSEIRQKLVETLKSRYEIEQY